MKAITNFFGFRAVIENNEVRLYKNGVWALTCTSLADAYTWAETQSWINDANKGDQ